jgi:hypothetical protein
MWICPYCGGTKGHPFADRNLQGVLCLEPDCGRFDDQGFWENEITGGQDDT